MGGSNYGQGSSREHAALVPTVSWASGAVIAKSFARIHVANLINAGILPLTFENPEDYDKLNQDAVLTISDILPAAWSRADSRSLLMMASSFSVNCASDGASEGDSDGRRTAELHKVQGRTNNEGNYTCL